MIELVLPQRSGDTLETLLDRLSCARGALPFDDRAMTFVGLLSRTVLGDRAFREHPEMMAMAHWFRPANLRDLRAGFLSADDEGSVFVRRGVVFHIAPSNVDSVFIYSWLLSVLCGNANIARVSRRRTAQMQAFFAATERLLERDEFRPIAEANLVLSYDHDPLLTERLSARCHLRAVWGGDSTVGQIRAVPLPPLATELAFANRFSLAAIRAEAVLALGREGRSALARGFYNDAFWFNQQACSSPRTVVWIGEGDPVRGARDLFWPALAAEIARRPPESLPAQVMDRTTTLFRLAHGHRGARAQTPPGALPARIMVDDLGPEDRDCHDGNGLFIELERPALADLLPMLASRDQTIAHFGFARSDWLALLPDLPPHAADRIVPIGEALAFSRVWDGVNLLRALTREIQVRAVG